MPAAKSAKSRMKDAVNQYIAAGDGFKANEITANVMVGTTMLIVFVVMLLCLLLNEVGVFTAEKAVMRWAVAIAVVIEVPITIINTKYVGTAPWLRWPLMIDLTLVCAVLAAALGHNVTLVMVFPIVVSTRYFDEKYTRNVAIITAVVFAIASFMNGFVGIMNLNMIKVHEAMSINILQGEELRQAIVDSPAFSKSGYIKSLFLNDFIPRCLVFLALSVSCRYVSRRGKDMIDLQAETSKKTSRIETELDLATKIQTSMLPCIFPAFPDHENINLHAQYHPAKEVGGDFYDYFDIDKTHVGLVIADVSGKGVGAALFMTISKTVLKNQLLLEISPEDALKNANHQLCENNDAGLFVTCWAGVYNTDTGVLTFVNAGHNPPVLIHNGGKPAFINQRHGFVLAGMDGYRYKQEELQLIAGDELIFYTDGVTEATNVQNELYGDDRLLDCMDRCKDMDLLKQLDFLKEDIDAFVGDREPFDDITIMGVKVYTI